MSDESSDDEEAQAVVAASGFGALEERIETVPGGCDTQAEEQAAVDLGPGVAPVLDAGVVAGHLADVIKQTTPVEINLKKVQTVNSG